MSTPLPRDPLQPEYIDPMRLTACADGVLAGNTRGFSTREVIEARKMLIRLGVLRLPAENLKGGL